LTLPSDLRRFLGPSILAASATFPVLLVTGARQVGKTTLLRAVAEPERRYVTLDDPLQLRLAREDPALFIQTWTPPVLIDEIQYAPELLPHIKMAVDQRGPRGGSRGSYWLTGSQPFHLMQGVSESLAGRVAVLPLLGLSSREAQALPDAGPFLPLRDAVQARQASARRCDLVGLYAQIWRGSYPALVANPAMDRDLFYASYLQTYLQATGQAGRQISADVWGTYIVFNMFRLAGILQGILGRALQGNASNAAALESGRRARPLAEQAWALAQTLHRGRPH